MLFFFFNISTSYVSFPFMEKADTRHHSAKNYSAFRGSCDHGHVNIHRMINPQINLSNKSLLAKVTKPLPKLQAICFLFFFFPLEVLYA